MAENPQEQNPSGILDHRSKEISGPGSVSRGVNPRPPILGQMTIQARRILKEWKLNRLMSGPRARR